MANLDDVQKIFDATMDEYGTVDVLFNNAGMLSMSPLMELSIEEWNNVFTVNVTSALRLTQLVAPVMKEKGKGTIINTCSVASFGAHHGFAAYVDSKHAMMGLTRSIAWELGPEIRCNGIAPGLIHTAMVDSIGGPSALQQMIDQCPVKRCGEGQDIATTALFLATDDSDNLLDVGICICRLKKTLRSHPARTVLTTAAAICRGTIFCHLYFLLSSFMRHPPDRRYCRNHNVADSQLLLLLPRPALPSPDRLPLRQCGTARLPLR